MEYSIIETAGKQYKVYEGVMIDIRGDLELNREIFFDKVLLSVFDNTVKIGNPYISDVVVKGKVIENKKSDKLKGFKFRAKSRYRRAYGSRFNVSQVRIEKIDLQEGRTTEQGKLKVAGKRHKAN